MIVTKQPYKSYWHCICRYRIDRATNILFLIDKNIPNFHMHKLDLSVCLNQANKLLTYPAKLSLEQRGKKIY